jgi:hypothetical protein
MIITEEHITCVTSWMLNKPELELLMKEVLEAYDKGDREHIVITFQRLGANIYVPRPLAS